STRGASDRFLRARKTRRRVRRAYGPSESAGKLSWDTNFLKTLAEKIWGPGDFEQRDLNPGGPTEPLVYKSSDIDRLHIEGRSGRGRQDYMPDAWNLSLAFRVLGDSLDPKGANEFVIL